MVRPPARPREPGAGGARRGVGVAVAALVTIVGWAFVEGLLHLAPGLLPAGYRESFPAHGVELWHPGVLARTPVEGLPVPMVPVPWTGPPPSDLREIGVVPAGVTVDVERFPSVRVPADARGLPNAEALERARTVLVGDSFLVSASCLEPPGLVAPLAAATRGPVYSLGVAGIGPLREAWLLENVGLALEPELVLWLFFGGNDLNDAKQVLEWKQAGCIMRSDLPGYRAPPLLRGLDLLRHVWRGPREEEAPAAAPLPPFLLRGPGGAAGEPVWFHPSHLGRLALSQADWRAHVAWPATQAALRRVRERCDARGARLAVVYLPSKAEALLPWIDADPRLLRRALSHGLAEPLALDPALALERMRAHRSSLDAVLASFCRAEGIPFFSATPSLELLAQEGTSGFLATDTHWSPRGVEAVLGPLVAFLTQHGLLAP